MVNIHLKKALDNDKPLILLDLDDTIIPSHIVYEKRLNEVYDFINFHIEREFTRHEFDIKFHLINNERMKYNISESGFLKGTIQTAEFFLSHKNWKLYGTSEMSFIERKINDIWERYEFEYPEYSNLEKLCDVYDVMIYTIGDPQQVEKIKKTGFLKYVNGFIIGKFKNEKEWDLVHSLFDNCNKIIIGDCGEKDIKHNLNRQHCSPIQINITPMGYNTLVDYDRYTEYYNSFCYNLPIHYNISCKDNRFNGLNTLFQMLYEIS